MKSTALKLTAFTFVMSMLFTGCGGGGSGGSTAGGAAGNGGNGSGTGGSTTPVAANLQTATPPNYDTSTVEGAEQSNLINAVNAFRVAQGLGPVNQVQAYDISSAALINYQSQLTTAEVNADQASGNQNIEDEEQEVSGRPGFTGALVSDREIAAGAPAGTNGSECAGFALLQDTPGNGTVFAERLFGTVYHRYVLMNQNSTGIGSYVDMTPPPAQPQGSAINLGYVGSGQNNAGNYVGVFPVNGQTNVPLGFTAERPSPLPVGYSPASVGYPITLASQQSTDLTVTSFTVAAEGSSTPLLVALITSSSNTEAGYFPNSASIIPLQNLAANTTYNVSFTGTATGAATGTTTGLSISKQWSFTTGSTVTPGATNMVYGN